MLTPIFSKIRKCELIVAFIAIVILAVSTYFLFVARDLSQYNYIHDLEDVGWTLFGSSIGAIVFFILFFTLKNSKIATVINAVLCLGILGGGIGMGCIMYGNKYGFDDAAEAKTHYLALTSSDSITQNKEMLRRLDYAEGYYHWRDIYRAFEKDTAFIRVATGLAHSNNATAQNILGVYYYSSAYAEYNRDEVDESAKERGFYWIKKSAENGDSIGQFNLGRFYAKRGFKLQSLAKNMNLAYKWWNKSAEQNYSKAFHSLGNLYGTWEYMDGIELSTASDTIIGINTDGNRIIDKFPMPSNWKHDIKLARSYWKKAADKDYAPSQKALEKVYSNEVESGASKLPN